MTSSSTPPPPPPTPTHPNSHHHHHHHHQHHHHHPPPNNDKEEEEDEEDGTTTAGLLRAAIRSSINIYRTIVFGSFPRRVPIKAVSRLSDQIGTAYDAYSVVTSTHKDIKEQQQQQQKPSSSSTSSSFSPSSNATAALARKAAVFGQTLKSAAPQLIKSGFLGTVVFELYAETKERLDDVFLYNDDQDDGKKEAEGAPTSISKSTTSPWQAAVVLPLTSLAGGGIAGACHGALFTGWEHGRRLVASSFKTASYPYVVNNVVGGTMVAHALSHCSLFGSFEILKEGLMHLTGARHEEPLGVVVVGLAGGLAGLCEEAVSHLTPHWETEGVSTLKEAIKRHGLPRMRVISSAALPTAVGFLAFEYSKSAVLGKAADEGEED